MAKNISVKAALKDAGQVRNVWESIPDFKMGRISFDDFIALHDATDASENEYAKKDRELTSVKDDRDDKALQLADLVTRFRSGMRSAYGRDSSQYGQSGGTRIRDRKAPRPKAKAAAA